MENELINAMHKWLQIRSLKPFAVVATEDQAMISDLWAAAEVIARRAAERKLREHMQLYIETDKALEEFRDAIEQALQTYKVDDARSRFDGEKVDQR